MEQRHQGERDTGVGHHPDEAVVAPGPQPEHAEFRRGEHQDRLLPAAARGGDRAAREHRPGGDADQPHGRLPERLELEAVVRAAERRSERQRHERRAPAAPRILLGAASEQTYREDAGDGREQVVGGEGHRLADHAFLVACTRISPRARLSSGRSAARSATARSCHPGKNCGNRSRGTAQRNGSFHSASSARSTQVALWNAMRPLGVGSITVKTASSPMAAKSALTCSALRYISKPSSTNTERSPALYVLALSACPSGMRARSAATNCRLPCWTAARFGACVAGWSTSMNCTAGN